MKKKCVEELGECFFFDDREIYALTKMDDRPNFVCAEKYKLNYFFAFIQLVFLVGAPFFQELFIIFAFDAVFFADLHSRKEFLANPQAD